MPGIEIGETRDGRVELQFDRACRAVALLADDHFGFAVDALAFGQPFGEFFPRVRSPSACAFGGSIPRGTRTAPRRHPARSSRTSRKSASCGRLSSRCSTCRDNCESAQDRNVELLGERLEPGGDFSDFLHAVFAGAAARSLQELDIVDHQEIEAALALEPARARRQLADRQTAGLVDVERQVLQFDRDVLDFLEIGFGDGAAADLVRGYCRSVRK